MDFRVRAIYILYFRLKEEIKKRKRDKLLSPREKRGGRLAINGKNEAF